MNDQPLNKRLCTTLCALFILGNGTIFLHLNNGAAASPFGLLISFALGAFLIPLTFKAFGKEFLKRTPFDIFKGMVFVFFALITAVDAAVDFALVSTGKILTTGNSLIFSIIFSLLVYFLLKADKRVLFKLSLIFLVLIIFSEIILFLTSANQFDFSNIKTLSTEKILPESLSFFAKCIAPIILLPFVLKREKSSENGAFLGILISFFLVLLPLVQILLIFGPAYAETLDFPFITVLDTVSIGLKFSRLEGIAFIIFFFGALIKCSVCLYCAKEILSKLFERFERFFPTILSVLLFFVLLFCEKIALQNQILSLIITFSAIAVLAVGLLKSRTHCRCRTK